MGAAPFLVARGGRPQMLEFARGIFCVPRSVLPSRMTPKSMKNLVSVIAGFGLLFLVSPIVVSAVAKEKIVQEKAAPQGSIRPKGKPKASERAALAKITF